MTCPLAIVCVALPTIIRHYLKVLTKMLSIRNQPYREDTRRQWIVRFGPVMLETSLRLVRCLGRRVWWNMRTMSVTLEMFQLRMGSLNVDL